MASCVGLLLGDSGDVTAAGWVIFLGLAGLVGVAIGIPFSLVIARLARVLAARTVCWLPAAVSASGLLAGTATCLNGINQSAFSAVGFGLSGFILSAVVAWAVLPGELGPTSFASVGTSTVAGMVAIVGACFGLAIVFAHRLAGESLMAFSPGAMTAYAVLFALPLTVLTLIIGAAAGLLARQRS